MAPPVQDAPALLKIDPSGAAVLSIVDHEGEEVDYLVEPAPPGFARWAVTLRRLDQRDGPYRVEMLAPGRWACDCGDSKFSARKQGRVCKHRVALRNLKRFIERLTSHDHENEEESR